MVAFAGQQVNGAVMKEVIRTVSLSLAYSIHTALEAAGIESVVQGENLIGTTAQGASVLVVHDEDFEPAREVLSDFNAEG